MPVVYPNWTLGEKETLLRNLGTMSYKDLAVLLPGRTVHAVKRRADLCGFVRDNAKQSRLARLRIARNDGFFAMPTDLSAYWAGFLAADGCVVTSPRHEVRLKLSNVDSVHVDQFCKDTGWSGTPYLSADSFYGVTVSGAKPWTQDLWQVWNIGPRKTWNLDAPRRLSPEFIPSYIAGYIDGDGCVFAREGTERQRIKVAGTKLLLEWIGAWVKSISGYAQGRIAYENGCCNMTFSDCSIPYVWDCVKKHSIPLLYRKWAKLIEKETWNGEG